MFDFPWDLLLPHLSRNKTICRGILGGEVATQGSSPYSESDFDAFLDACGIEVRHVSGGEPPTVIVLGRARCDLDEIRQLRTEARVYSQEMVVASMAIGTDIFELFDLDEITGQFVEGHPGLESYYWGSAPSAQSDYWGPAPSQQSAEPLAGLDDTGPVETFHIDFEADTLRPSLGVLKDMGYRAGQSGLLPHQRREVLRRVLFVKLVANSPWTEEYIREWGEPGTYGRLGKTTRVLAGLARIARRKKTADMSEAIDDWESDLAWLNETYGH